MEAGLSKDNFAFYKPFPFDTIRIPFPSTSTPVSHLT